MGIAILGTTLFTAAPANAATVSFADPALQACVNSALGHSAADPVSDTEAATVISLQCPGQGIADLQGIQSLTALTTLDLTANQVTNLGPLAGLGQIQDLSLTANSISDITPLGGLTTLTTLDLASNQIVTLTPLSALTQLTSLQLHFNSIVDVSPLAGLTQIHELKLNSNQIFDVSPLAALAAAQQDMLDGRTDASNQSPTLADIEVGVVQQNPLRGFGGDGDRPEVFGIGGPVTVAPDGASWSFTALGTGQLAWSWQGAGYLNFSGIISQEAVEHVPTETMLTDDVATTPVNTPVLVDVLANDGEPGQPALIPSTLTLLDQDGNAVSTLTLAAGVFSLDSEKVLFTPATGFVGAVPAVTYRVTNVDELSSTATITVTVIASPTVPPTTPATVPGAGNTTGSNALASTGLDIAGSPAVAVAVLLLLTGGAGVLSVIVRRKRRGV